MDNNEEIIMQIKTLCSAVSEHTYEPVMRQSHELLGRLCDLGAEKEMVYQSLLRYHNSLEDDLSRDCAAEILDFVAGWCSPQKWIWED